MYNISTRHTDLLEIRMVNGPNIFLSLLYTGHGEYSTNLRLGFASGKTQLLGFASGETRKMCVI